MKKIAIVYYSGTGNTLEMANAVYGSIKNGNNEAELFNVSDITADQAKNYDILVLGCPAMGAEELEEEEMEPFFTELETNLQGKTVALFGSYGWGDGEWMRNWEERVKNAGATLLKEGIICMDSPDVDTLEELTKLGEEISTL